jgi:protein-S-isoprenylcysteine O-methyltransferase Ste14
MNQTNDADRRSTAKSWLAVLMLSLVIFGVIRGITSLWGGKERYALPYWMVHIYGVDEYGDGLPWRRPAMIAAVLAIVFSILLALLIVRKWSRNRRKAERRVLITGAWALYFPTVLGSLPAIFGIIAMMGTPFLVAGLLPVVSLFLPEDIANWVYRGTVGGWDDYDIQRCLSIAQPIVALGLALTIIGLIQVFRACREKRLQNQGLYATVRHPQHLGIALWTFGLALAVNTVAGYMMWFTVTYVYVLLALREERLLAERFGGAYDSYRKATTFMIPFVTLSLALPESGGRRTAAFIAYYVAGMALLCLIMYAVGVFLALFA